MKKHATESVPNGTHNHGASEGSIEERRWGQVHSFRILIDQLRTLVDLVFGYDYFISYSHSDGANYPTRLADRLETFGYRTFLDNRVYIAGTDLQTATKRRVRMSKFLIVVGREKALKSEWVVKEVHRSLEANRVPILIDINETFKKKDDALEIRRLLKDRLYIPERLPDVDGEPSSEVLEKLKKSFKGIRQETFRLRLVSLLAFIFALVAAFAIWQWVSAAIAERKAREAASQANVSLARNSQAVENDNQALAYLANALRLNPRNSEAGALTLALLTQESWLVLTGAMTYGHVVGSAQFSPDGQRVVTASWDHTARVWDAATGKALSEPMKHDDGVVSAQFSPDGQRVVTASWDHTARVWDAATGKALSEPMKHDNEVGSAQFSPDGQRVVTASLDKTAHVWYIPTIKSPYSDLWGALLQYLSSAYSTRKDSADDANLLADVAEAACGSVLQASGQSEILIPLTPEQVRATRDKIAARFAAQSSNLTPLQRFLKWSVSGPRARSISPVSDLTVADWVKNRIQEGTLDDLQVAMIVDPANARLAAHFGLALANLAVAETTDPDDARRARAEADYQTHRAVKLASDNKEVKKLREEVVKLLQLPE
jgi:hypothetical protein